MDKVNSAEVRVGPLVNVARILRSLDCDPVPVFAHAGFTEDDFLDTEQRIDFQAGDALLAECIRVTQCEHFGIKLGQWALARHLGLVAEISGCAATVGAALQDIVAYLGLHDNGGIAAINSTEKVCTFSYGLHVEGLQATEVIYDLSATMICNIMRGLCGTEWTPTSVYIGRSRPADIAPYRRCLRSPVHFDATATTVVFPSEWLDRVPREADAAKHTALQDDANKLHNGLHPDMAGQVRDRIRRGLMHGDSDVTYVAGVLKLHERTLNRRLNAEGTSYREQLESVRYAVGQHYLAGTDLSVSDIAYALGYGSTAAFDHAFKRWASISPGAWRQQFTAEHKLDV